MTNFSVFDSEYDVEYNGVGIVEISNIRLIQVKFSLKHLCLTQFRSGVAASSRSRVTAKLGRGKTNIFTMLWLITNIKCSLHEY